LGRLLEAGDAAALVGTNAGDTLAGFRLKRLLNAAKARIQFE
jgi:hypothetical protein